ncbi:heme-binding protein [Psychrobacter sp. JCM 18901]|uniref:heme-binding protein n=1 Tax=Psychrobacter sp. JCM 18901 TaxID=1298609 RepID=UPI0021C3A1ED|nr:heme-binding protein [Psychrobacter sp. JCM 18901]
MQQDNGKWRVQFTMPSKYTMQTLPKPNNPNVEIIEVPAQTYGVIKFSWLAGKDKVAEKNRSAANMDAKPEFDAYRRA